MTQITKALRIADALEKCDWAGCSIGNKEILRAAVAELRALSTLPIAGEPLPAELTGPLQWAMANAFEASEADTTAGKMIDVYDAVRAALSSPGKGSGQEVEAVVWSERENAFTDFWEQCPKLVDASDVGKARQAFFAGMDAASFFDSVAIKTTTGLVERLRKRADEDQACADNSKVIVDALSEQMRLFESREGHNVYAVRMAVDHKSSLGRDSRYAADLREAAEILSRPQPASTALVERLERERDSVVGEPGPMQHVRAHAHLIRCFADEMTDRNWADKALYIKQQAERIMSEVDALPDGWRSIETAPRDGTIVDLLTAGGSIAHDEWWIEDDGEAFWSCDFDDNFITHWRPASSRISQQDAELERMREALARIAAETTLGEPFKSEDRIMSRDTMIEHARASLRAKAEETGQ